MSRERAPRYRNAGRLETMYKWTTSSEFRAGYREFKFRGQVRSAIDKLAHGNGSWEVGPEDRHFDTTMTVRGTRYRVEGQSVNRIAVYTRSVTMETGDQRLTISLYDSHSDNIPHVGYQNGRNLRFEDTPSAALIRAAHDVMPSVNFNLIVPRRRRFRKTA